MKKNSVQRHSQTNLLSEGRGGPRPSCVFLDPAALRHPYIVTLLAAVTALLLAVSTAHAGRYELVKRSDPGGGRGYVYSDVPGGVCEAYEKNLARFENEPYGMACGRKLDPALGFTRPTWEKLDVFKHAELVHEIFFALRWEFPWQPDPRPWMDRLKEAAGRGMVLEITRVDLDGDGKPENLLRIGKERLCDPKEEIKHSSSWGKRIVIVDSALTKVEATISPPNDVFLYKGNVYSDMLGLSGQSGRPGGPDAALLLFQFARRGAGHICNYHYYAAPHNQLNSKGGNKP